MNNFTGNEKNIIWINTGRALCMICVYIAHCNVYYLNHTSPLYFLYKPFYLAFFFFLSGFLFFKNLDNFPFKKKISSILNKLVWPVIFFPSLIWVPKMIAHGGSIGLEAYLTDILGGTAAWFVSTIIVAQLISLLLVYVFKKRLFAMLLISCITMFSAFYLRSIDPTPFPWYYKSGMIAVFFLVLGGIARKYYDKLERIISLPYLLESGVLYICLMLYNYYYLGYYQAIMSVDYDNIPLGLFNNLLGIFFMIQLCHYIPEIKWLQYIGKNSIIFYFFGGGVPLVMGYLVRTYIPFQGYLMTILVTILCLVIVFPINYIIKRYFAWTLDFSKITNLFKR